MAVIVVTCNSAMFVGISTIVWWQILGDSLTFSEKTRLIRRKRAPALRRPGDGSTTPEAHCLSKRAAGTPEAFAQKAIVAVKLVMRQKESSSACRRLLDRFPQD